MRNIFEVPATKPRKKEKLNSGLGKETGLPSKRGTYIPYDSFLKDPDDISDLSLEPKADKLSGHRKKLITEGKYVPAKVLRGGMSDEQISNIYKSKEEQENALNDLIDNPQISEVGEPEFTEVGHTQDNDETLENPEIYSEAKGWDHNLDIENDEILISSLDAVADSHGINHDKLAIKEAMSRRPIMTRKLWYKKDAFKAAGFGESHVSDPVTAAQQSRRVNKDLGKKIQEHFNEKHNEEVAIDEEIREDLTP